MTKGKIRKCVRAIEKKIIEKTNELYEARALQRKAEEQLTVIRNELYDARRQCKPHKFDKNFKCIHCGENDY